MRRTETIREVIEMMREKEVVIGAACGLAVGLVINRVTPPPPPELPKMVENVMRAILVTQTTITGLTIGDYAPEIIHGASGVIKRVRGGR